MSEIAVAVVTSVVVASVVMLALGVARSVGRPSIAVAIGLAAVAVVVMVLPFGLKTSNGTTFYDGISNRCRPPVLSAWRRERMGHFPLPGGYPSCVDPARHRLAVAGALIAGGTVIVIVPRRRHARPSNAVPV